MKRLTKAALIAVIAMMSIQAESQITNILNATPADYNAAQVAKANGVLTVPAGSVSYVAQMAIASGTTFQVKLPSGISFKTVPALTSTDGTLTLNSASGGTANYTLHNAPLSNGSTITFGSFIVQGATALEKITQPSEGLPLSVQANGYDTKPLTAPLFASDSGVQATFTGAVNYIDLNAPWSGTQFGIGSQHSLTTLLGSIQVVPELTDFNGGSFPILGANGQPYSINSSDTVEIVIPGLLIGGLKGVFASTSSDCSTELSSRANALSTLLDFHAIPLNETVYLCATGGGQPIKLFFGLGNENISAIQTLLLNPETSGSDFTYSSNVSFVSAGEECYAYKTSGASPSDCQPVYYQYLYPGHAKTAAPSTK